MSSVKIIDKYTIEFFKGDWSKNDRMMAACVDVEINDSTRKAKCDIRITGQKALRNFMKEVFPYITNHSEMVVYRKSLYSDFKVMYDNVLNEFMETHYKKLGYTRELYQHQKETLCASVNRRVNLWALSMGLGKTISAASLSKITGARRTIIICPSLVKFNWLEDMTKYWGYNMIYWTVIDAVKSRSVYAFDERFVVLNYEMVGKHMDYLLRDRIDHIILDECHMLKNMGSNRSKSVRKLIEDASNPRVTMLTGTPVTNRIDDMFNYLRMAGHPLGQNFAKFKERYTLTNGTRGKITGAHNLPELKSRVSNLMIRLRSEDCLDLPPMVMKNCYFEFEDLSKEYGEELDKLRQKKEKYDLLEGKEKQQMSHEIKANIHTLNRIVSTSKVPKIKELVDNLIEQGEKVIVFCDYKDPLNRLETLFGETCVKINGSVPSHKRLDLINRFKEDDNCKVFLANTQAGGIGINLVNARYVIFMNFSFTPDRPEQAQKRAHRPGQTRTVFVYYAICKGTIDEHIHDLLHGKAEDINALIDEDNAKGLINYKNIPSMLFKKLLE
jgi:SNF2 family DNA or RNA helicase